ncbi:uncharacterized protein N7477_001915 [Penicillium maclennaniae]|uniref:uncharacterized protein n=1 Tax=Penicillium maclennaniae TaxID=1343394 RepID=UPI00253FF6DB|nr:uncharacterized protein N7477_001915 [Penicillium maclennaniae]KAJ5681975.1 hypothetical protein N7477_001915 [Penicillium maclennaniae]
MRRNAITEMKNRLERLESLLSPSKSKFADHENDTPVLPVAGDNEPSFYLTDRMGFSSFIVFFTYVNSVIPLYDQERFMRLFNQQYSDNPPTSVSWYASLHAVLGIGELVFEDEIDAEASYMAIGAAARLALGLGLHRTLVDSHLTLSEVEERRNVFWVLYVLDRGVSLRLGRPPTICEEDIEVSEPSLGKASQPSQVRDGFAHLVKLNRIKSEIYSKLYSARSWMGDCQAKRLACLRDLDEKLIIWQKSLPKDMLPIQRALHYPNAVFSTMTVLLYAEYYNCQLMLYRTDNYWESLESNENSVRTSISSSNPSGFSSRKKCLTAARHTAELLEKFQQTGNAFRSNLARYLSYYPLTAYFDIFLNLLEHPLDSSNSADLRLLHIVMDSMLSALTTTSSPLALLLAEVFQKMTGIAHNILIHTKIEGVDQKLLPQVITATNAAGFSVNATGGFPSSAPATKDSDLDTPVYHTSLPPPMHTDMSPYFDESGPLGPDTRSGPSFAHPGSADGSLSWAQRLHG